MISIPQLSTIILAAAGLASATNVHANSGCILVEGNPLCAGGGSVAVSDGSARIHGRFSGNTNAAEEYSGCFIDATWDASFGDIYYGDDNCIYDARGQNINGQCCVSGQELVTNPYFEPSDEI